MPVSMHSGDPLLESGFQSLLPFRQCGQFPKGVTKVNFQLFGFPALPLLVAFGLSGCAATIDQAGLAQRTSAAIGHPVGSFTLSDQSEETGGRINYKATTRDGATYQCYLYSATGFQKLMSLGQTPNSDAICTPMDRRGTKAGAGGPPSPACNALNKAAGRC